MSIEDKIFTIQQRKLLDNALDAQQQAEDLMTVILTNHQYGVETPLQMWAAFFQARGSVQAYSTVLGIALSEKFIFQLDTVEKTGFRTYGRLVLRSGLKVDSLWAVKRQLEIK